MPVPESWLDPAVGMEFIKTIGVPSAVAAMLGVILYWGLLAMRDVLNDLKAKFEAYAETNIDIQKSILDKQDVLDDHVRENLAYMKGEDHRRGNAGRSR